MKKLSSSGSEGRVALVPPPCKSADSSPLSRHKEFLKAKRESERHPSFQQSPSFPGLVKSKSECKMQARPPQDSGQSPALGNCSSFFGQCGSALSISGEGSALGVVIMPLSLSSRAFLMKRIIRTIYPELSEMEIEIKNRSVFLGSRKIGSFGKEGEGPYLLRVWIDKLLPDGIKQEYLSCRFSPEGHKDPAATIPISAIFGLVRASDCRPLISAIGKMRHASIVTDGYSARIEFHLEKRAKPFDSFIIRLNS
ncbi:MAG: hypothetical protein QXH30_03085 [Candidatus Bilamarchaeaceae archaeon]